MSNLTDKTKELLQELAIGMASSKVCQRGNINARLANENEAIYLCGVLSGIGETSYKKGPDGFTVHLVPRRSPLVA